MSAYVTSVSNLSNLTNLGRLNLVVNHLTSLNLTGCGNLIEISLQNNQLTSLDLSDSPNLTSINIGNNPNLNTITLPTLLFCIYFSAFGGSLPTTAINNIFTNLSDQGITGGYAFMDGGSNGIPNGVGLSAALYLQGDLGWTVTYNS